MVSAMAVSLVNQCTLPYSSAISLIVQFSSKSHIISLEDMYRTKQTYIKEHGTYSSFPQYLKTNREKALKISVIETKLSDGQVSPINVFHILQTCPATSVREISLRHPVLKAATIGLSYPTSDIN